MVAVAPPAPKPQLAQGSRTARPTAGSANFSRVLQQTTDEHRPLPETEPAQEDHTPEAEPKATPHAADQAPIQTGEKKTTDQDQEQEEESRPQGTKDGAMPAPATPQPIMPLPAPEIPAAPIPDQVAAAVGAMLAATTNTKVLPTPVPGTGAVLAAGKAEAPPSLVPGSAVLPTPPATAKAEGSQTQTKNNKTQGDKTEALTADQLPADQQLNLDSLQPKVAARPQEKNTSADLLSFDELMHSDLKTNLSPEPVLDQLQQAMSTAMLDESTQLVMPQVIRGLATLVSEGLSEMRLQLMPEDLGEIEVRVRTSEGVVRGEMMVQNPEIKQLLDQHLDRLRNALHQQGLDLRGFDIGLAPDGRFAQPDRSGRGFEPQGNTRRQGAATSAPPEVPVLAPRGALAVDYLA